MDKGIEKKVANYSLEEVKAFKIFNIPPTKNTEIIKKTYKKLVKKYQQYPVILMFIKLLKEFLI